MLTNTIVEICSTSLTTAPRRLHCATATRLRLGPQCPGLDGFLVIIVLFSRRIPPNISLRLLLRLNANIGSSSKVSANFSLVCNMCQLLSKTFLMLGKPLLYWVMNLILLSPFFSLYVRSCLRSILLTLAKCSSSIDFLYPLTRMVLSGKLVIVSILLMKSVVSLICDLISLTIFSRCISTKCEILAVNRLNLR